MTLRDTPRKITIIFIEMSVFLSLVSIEFGDRNACQYINDTSIAFSVSVSHSRSLSSLHVRRTHINRIFMDKCEINSNPISSKRKNKYTNSIYAIVVLIKTNFFFVMEFSLLFYGWTEPCSDVVVVVVDVRYFSFTIWFIWFVLGIQCTNTYGAWTQWNRFNYFFLLRHIGCESRSKQECCRFFSLFDFSNAEFLCDANTFFNWKLRLLSREMRLIS